MIYDKLSNIAKYNFNNKGLSDAVMMVSCLDFTKIIPGYVATYDNFSISVKEYLSKPRETVKYELHRNAIDIHIILEGTEYVECTCIDELTIDEPYDEDKDIAFGSAENNCSIRLKPGWFLICFPQDAHLVGAHEYSSCSIKKCIVKVFLGSSLSVSSRRNLFLPIRQHRINSDRHT